MKRKNPSRRRLRRTEGSSAQLRRADFLAVARRGRRDAPQRVHTSGPTHRTRDLAGERPIHRGSAFPVPAHSVHHAGSPEAPRLDGEAQLADSSWRFQVTAASRAASSWDFELDSATTQRPSRGPERGDPPWSGECRRERDGHRAGSRGSLRERRPCTAEATTWTAGSAMPVWRRRLAIENTNAPAIWRRYADPSGAPSAADRTFPRKQIDSASAAVRPAFADGARPFRPESRARPRCVRTALQ